MMKKINLILFLLVSSMALWAETDAEILTKISDFGKKTNTIVCSFTQRKHLKVVKNDAISKGKFYYQSTDKVCMEFEQPQGDLLLMNGDNFVMQTNGKRTAATAQSNPMLKQMRMMLSACITGDFKHLKMGKNSSISVAVTENNYILTLVPGGSARNYFSTIVLTYEKNDLSLSVLRMNETNGNFTQYTFSNKKFNQNISEKVFNVNR